jgi:hypothetical protein
MFRRIAQFLANLSADPSDLRRASRIPAPEIAAYFWDGSVPKAHALRDVSLTGAYLYTSERWYSGTIVRLLLQGSPPAGAEGAVDQPVSVSIPARVVWAGEDGVALDFLFATPDDQKRLTKLIACGRARGTLNEAEAHSR